QPQIAAAVPLSPPRELGHDRPQECGCGFWMDEGHRRDGMVALGCGTRLLPGRRTQSAVGHVRLDLVLLYFRCRSTADHANRGGSPHTDIPEPSLTVSSLGILIWSALADVELGGLRSAPGTVQPLRAREAVRVPRPARGFFFLAFSF